MADEARQYNMSIGLKNSISILPKVSKFVQFAVNEECATMKECSGYKSFLMTKPVFHIEYVKTKGKMVSGGGNRNGFGSGKSGSGGKGKGLNVEAAEAAEAGVSKYCTPSNAPDLGPKFSTVIKVEDLDGWVRFCDGKEATTRVTKEENGKGKGRSRMVENSDMESSSESGEEADSDDSDESDDK
jgi:hypothetical protein